MINELTPRNNNHAYWRLHIAILLAGGTGLFGRLISIGELPLVCARVVFAGIILALVMAAKKQLHSISKKDLLKMCGLGVILTVHWVFYYGSIKAANISIGAVCFALVGFMTAVIEPIFDRHKPSLLELTLSAFTVLGIALIFGFDSRYRLGIGIGCISSLLYVFYSIFCKRYQASSGQNSSTMLLYEMLGGGIVLMLLIQLYSTLFPDVKIMPSISDFWLLILFASLFTVLPFLLQLQALRHISAFTVNLSYNLEPVYTIFLAMILFNEASELNLSFWIGILLIILSVVLQTIVSIRNAKTNKHIKK